MRKTFVKIISRQVHTAAILTDAPAVEASAGSADSNSHVEILSSNIQSKVRFKRREGKSFLFDVTIENPDSHACLLEVRNDSGRIVSSNHFTDQKVLHEVKLSNEELTAHYNFVIKAANRDADHTFIVSITTKATEAIQAA